MRLGKPTRFRVICVKTTFKRLECHVELLASVDINEGGYRLDDRWNQSDDVQVLSKNVDDSKKVFTKRSSRTAA